MRTIPFLITGCGRSGTRYIADLLTALRIPTGWEQTLNPLYPEQKPKDYLAILKTRGLCGDANWLATAYLHRMPRSVLLCHQTRHPLMVTRSMLALGFFGYDFLPSLTRANLQHHGLAVQNLPGIEKLPTGIERCLYYWVKWNELCETRIQARGMRVFRYQFEHLLDHETSVLDTIYRGITRGEFKPGTTRIIKNIPEVKNVHKMFAPNTGPFLAWDDIPDGKLKHDAIALAKRYGYEA